MLEIFKRKVETESPNKKLLDLQDEILELKMSIKEIKNDIVKMDIRILENQKNYQTKLLRLVKNEEKVEETEQKKDINSSVFLYP